MLFNGLVDLLLEVIVIFVFLFIIFLHLFLLFEQIDVAEEFVKDFGRIGLDEPGVLPQIETDDGLVVVHDAVEETDAFLFDEVAFQIETFGPPVVP